MARELYFARSCTKYASRANYASRSQITLSAARTARAARTLDPRDLSDSKFLESRSTVQAAQDAPVARASTLIDEFNMAREPYSTRWFKNTRASCASYDHKGQ